MGAPVKLFADRTHYRPRERAQLSDLLRPYWKEGPFSDEQRRQMYGLSEQDFQISPSLEDADMAVLPMSWNYYMAQGAVGRAKKFVELARRAGVPVLSYVTGDEGVRMPDGFEDVFVLRASGLRSRKTPRQMALPVFLKDPLEHYPGLEGYGRPPRANNSPIVGFCGQASLNPFKPVLDLARTVLRNAGSKLRLRAQEPQPFYPSALLRSKALRVLARSPRVETRFILRSRYRAGANGSEARETTSKEFYTNITESDYILCVRGGGNFSKRLYETLAMGRIPILVDTDCCLPLDSAISWDKHIVRVPLQSLATLPGRVAEHFEGLDDLGLRELKMRCRALWRDFLSFGGYHIRMVRLILKRV